MIISFTFTLRLLTQESLLSSEYLYSCVSKAIFVQLLQGHDPLKHPGQRNGNTARSDSGLDGYDKRVDVLKWRTDTCTFRPLWQHGITLYRILSSITALLGTTYQSIKSNNSRSLDRVWSGGVCEVLRILRSSSAYGSVCVSICLQHHVILVTIWALGPLWKLNFLLTHLPLLTCKLNVAESARIGWLGVEFSFRIFSIPVSRLFVVSQRSLTCVRLWNHFRNVVSWNTPL